MKILYCDMEYCYGDREKGPNTIGNAIQAAFSSLGHSVTQLYYDKYIKSPSPVPELQAELLEKAGEIKPDIVFFPMFTFQFAVETLDQLKQRFETIAWFGDDTWRFDDYTRLYAPHFSWCVTTDKFSVDKYKSVGQDRIILSQWAAIETSCPGVCGTYSYEVSFVGQFDPFRAWFLGRLEAAGLKVKAFGHGWENGSISLEEMGEVFRQSKINLNLSNSISHDIRFLFSNPSYLLRYFRIKKTVGQIKARNFEIPYFGGFQLTDYYPGIEEYFDIGQEIACFRDVDEAVVLAKYYLAHEDLRAEMANRASRKARECHGYINRMRQIIEAIKAA